MSSTRASPMSYRVLRMSTIALDFLDRSGTMKIICGVGPYRLNFGTDGQTLSGVGIASNISHIQMSSVGGVLHIGRQRRGDGSIALGPTSHTPLTAPTLLL